MLWHVIDACRNAGVDRLVVVIGFGKEAVKEVFARDKDITWVEQTEQKGTGHAALVCREAVGNFDGPVLTIAGDMPLIRDTTLRDLLNENRRTGDAVTLATSVMEDPTTYGRIIRDDNNDLIGIVEENDCSPRQKKIKEVNVSYYCFDGARMFDLLGRVGNNNVKGEYYITDTVEIALSRGAGAGAIAAVPAEDAMGINSRADLAKVAQIMQERIQFEHMEAGVTIVAPCCTWIETGVQIGPDTMIYPYSIVGSDAVIGRSCRIGPHAMIGKRQQVADGATAGPHDGGGA